MTSNRLLVALTAGFLILSLGEHAAQPRNGSIVPDRIVVVFRNMALPDDVRERVEAAGGIVISQLDEVGVLIASPGSADASTVIRNLRREAVVLDAGYDAVLDLIAPSSLGADAPDGAPSPATHLAHPLPTFSPLLPADFFYTSSPQQWAVKRVGAQGGGIPGGGSGAWDSTFGAGTRIAILDTGVTPEHPDLSPNLLLNTALTFDIPSVFGTPNCEVPNPANPLVDLPEDQFGHGTFTSSLAAAAAGAGTGLLIGVAPEAKILNIKVLRARPATPAELATLGVPDTPYNRCRFRSANALVSWVLQGMLVANAFGADVISMSLGAGFARNLPGGDGAAVWSAFNRVANFVTSRGSVLVAAAGNNAVDLDRVKAIVAVPVDSPNVIAVTATTNPAVPPLNPPAQPPCASGEDCLASYSNYGSSLHGVAAPGGDLPAGSCAPSGTPCLPTGFLRGACAAGVHGTTEPASAGYPASGPPPPGTSWGCFGSPAGFQHAWYIQATGTSAATPLVAGVAALIKSANPTLTPAQVRTILQQTAEDIGPTGHDQFFNFGLVNASAAVARAGQ